MEALRKELICPVCLEIYIDPKILQCFHVFCQKCLVKLVFRDQEGKLSLPCPICRQETPLPVGTTTSLPSDFRVNRLIEILEKHSSCSPKQPQDIYCSEHSTRKVELFCETCEELVCCKCVIQGGKHHSHDYKNITESFEIYKEQLAPSLKQLEKKLATTTKVLSQVNKCCDEVLQQQGAIKANIQDWSKNLIEIINRRQHQLLDQVDKITNEKLARLTAQNDRIMTLQSQLSSCLEFTKESIKAEPQQHEVLVMKTDILKQVRELATPFQPDTVTPCTEADIVFSASEEPIAACNELGRVYTPNSLNPSNCIAMGKGTEGAVVGEKAFVKLRAINFKGGLCSETFVRSASIEVELLSCLTEIKRKGHIEQITDERYVVSYQPVVKGRHKLYIKVDGEQIKESPFSILIKSPVEQLGMPIQAISGSLRGPTDVTFNGTGEIIVTDRHAHCVTVFTQNGRRLRSFGTHGPKDGQFIEPFGVTVDAEGNIIVSDPGSHRIQKFSTDGAFLQVVGQNGSGKLQFYLPYGISYSASNDKLYVCDSFNCRIQVLNCDFTYHGMFGTKGSGHGKFERPRNIATDSIGKVYVTDYFHHHIQVFTAAGEFLMMFGRKGEAKGELCRPVGIAVDTDDHVYVTEFDNDRVSVFTSEGRFVTAFGSRGEEPGMFLYLYGLAVDSSGVVCVCDCGNRRIQIF